MLKPLLTSQAPEPPHPTHIAGSMLGAVVAISALGWLSQHTPYPWLMAPFGASCALVFGMPDSPLAQPRSVIGGHLLSAIIGLLFLHLFGANWASAAAAVALAIGAMQATRTMHAPAGGNPLLAMAAGASWDFMVTPVLSGALVIVVTAFIVNNLRPGGRYPRYWR